MESISNRLEGVWNMRLQPDATSQRQEKVEKSTDYFCILGLCARNLCKTQCDLH